MVRLFRGLKNSLSGGKSVRNYLLYALGEIVLVVLGILIAIYIDDWNDERHRLENERYALEEILDDLTEEGRIVNSIHRQRVETQASILRMASYLDEPGTINVDTFSYDLAQLLTFERYFPIRTAYEIAKVGGLSISDKELRSAIAGYYEYEQDIMRMSLKDVEDAFLGQFPSIPTDNYTIVEYGDSVRLREHADPAFLQSIRDVLSFFVPNHSGTLRTVAAFRTDNAELAQRIGRWLEAE